MKPLLAQTLRDPAAGSISAQVSSLLMILTAVPAGIWPNSVYATPGPAWASVAVLRVFLLRSMAYTETQQCIPSGEAICSQSL